MSSLLQTVESNSQIEQEEFLEEEKSVSTLTKQEIEEGYQGAASRLSKIMKAKTLSDAQVSVWLDVTPKTNYNWRKRGGWSVLENTLLATYLEVDPNWLATGTSQNFLIERKGDTVEFDRVARFEGVDKPLIDRFLPAISTSEIGMGRDHVQSILDAYRANRGDRLGISVAFFNPNVPGIPKYCMQIILPEFKDDMPLGTMIGLADDISPIPGDFIVGKNDGKFIAGFFYPVAGQIVSSNRSQSYFDLESFTVSRRRYVHTVMDVTCTHDTFELIGVCTYKAEWLSPSLVEEQTHLRDRMKTAFESRRLDK